MKMKKQDRPGRPASKQPMSVFSVYCSNDTQEKFREMAQRSGYTYGEFMEVLLAKY